MGNLSNETENLSHSRGFKIHPVILTAICDRPVTYPKVNLERECLRVGEPFWKTNYLQAVFHLSD